MRLGVDLQLEALQGDQFNKLDYPIKDFFLNAAIADFIKENIDSANPPNTQRRSPGGVVTYKDIINKYNNIRTIIKTVDILASSFVVPGGAPAYFNEINLPTDLLYFETSLSNVTVGTKTGYISNLTPETYDIAAFNNDSYGGKKKYMASYIYGSTLRLYNLSRYTINSVSIFYVCKPVQLSTGVDCNLPEETHNEIVNRAARYIAGVQSNPNYQFLANEDKPIQS